MKFPNAREPALSTLNNHHRNNILCHLCKRIIACLSQNKAGVKDISYQ